jgi:hypothetical protein
VNAGRHRNLARNLQVFRMLPRWNMAIATSVACLLVLVGHPATGQEQIRDLTAVREVGASAGGYAAVGGMGSLASGAIGAGSRLVVGTEVGAEVGIGPVAFVDVQGLLFLPEPPDASLAGGTAALGAGYRWRLPILRGATVGVHLGYGASFLRVDGEWGSATFNGTWHLGQVGMVDVDFAVPVGADFAVSLQPRYMVMPESGFVGHFIGGNVGVRYVW